MVTDPFDDAEWRDYAQWALDDLMPMMRNFTVIVSVVPRVQADVKFATELGLAIMLDKPIIAVVTPGTQVPAKLVTVADAIVEGDLKDPGFVALLNLTIRDLVKKAGER